MLASLAVVIERCRKRSASTRLWFMASWLIAPAPHLRCREA